MYVALFQASDDPAFRPPGAADLALVGTHDTPTFAGWLAGADIDERVRYALLAEPEAPAVRKNRQRAARRLARRLRCRPAEPRALLAALLEWLGRSDSPLVVPWLEDLWLEECAVNLPGTRSSVRPNWQRPMRHLLDEIFANPEVDDLLRRLHRARNPQSSGTLRVR
jgi:4-alpha-glucanotransferase